MVDKEDEDTIEIQLTPSQLAGLQSAAERAERDAEAAALAGLRAAQPVLNTVPRRTRRRYFALAGVAVALVLSVATAYQLGTRHRPPPPREPARETIEQPPGSGARLPATGPPEAIPVRVANPFDASEVFEFPPGTSQTKARDAV